MKTIVSLAVLVSAIYLYLVYKISPEWSILFGFSDDMYLLKKGLLYLLLGVGALSFIMRFKSEKLFDKIGALLCILSFAMLLSMFFLPNSLAPSIDAKKLYIIFAGVHIYPMLLFGFGVMWLVNYLNNSQSSKRFTFSVIGLMLVSGIFSLSFHDYGMFLLLEIFLIFVLFYTNGINKYLIGTILSVIVAVATFLVVSPHRLSRLQSWMSSSDIAIIQNPMELGSLSLLSNHFGTISLLFIVVLFAFLIYLLTKQEMFDKKHKLFKVSIAATLTISLGLNLLNVFGLLLVSPPPLYFFDYGFSITIISYLMVALLGV